MNLWWGHLCTDVFWMGTGAGVLNVIHSLGADPGKPPEFPLPIHLGFRVTAFPDEDVGTALQVVLTDERDQMRHSPLTVPVEFQDIGSGYPRLGGGKLRLDQASNLPSVGAYSFDFFDKASTQKPFGRVALTISPRQGKTIRGKLDSDDPVRLAWAHFLLSYQVDGGAGLPSLVGVHEFIPLPAGMDRVNLKGTLLMLQIEADLTIQTERQLQVTLLDATGREAKGPEGRPIMPAYWRPIRLRRPSSGIDMLVSTANVIFERDVMLPLGTYNFVFQLDGQPLGQPLSLVVIPNMPSYDPYT